MVSDTSLVSNSNKKVVMMAGGTGGHVFPALAVADELRAANIDVAWLGTAKGLEAKLVPAANIPLHIIEVAGLRGKSAFNKLLGPLTVAKAIWQSWILLRKIRPNVVVGMGGYASGPGGIAARLLGIPLIIHEQNARAGSTNKILAKFAQRVLTGFPDALPKGEFIGNPVRKVFYQCPPPSIRFQQAASLNNKPFKLLVLGGSLGAKALNTLVPAALAKLPENQVVHILHQSGERTLDLAKEAYASLSKVRPEYDIQVLSFIEDVAKELAQADLVICRSGALTVAEIAAVGVASILVPFPYAIDDHQMANAQWLKKKEAAYVFAEAELSIEKLAETLAELLADRQKLLAMSEAALSHDTQAAEKAAAICMEYINV